MITGFMEIYFAVMCSENIILWKDSLPVVHVCNDTDFFQTVWKGISEIVIFIILIYAIYFCLEEVS